MYGVSIVQKDEKGINPLGSVNNPTQPVFCLWVNRLP